VPVQVAGSAGRALTVTDIVDARRRTTHAAADLAGAKILSMSPARGVQTAFDLFGLAVEMLRTRMRRERPTLSDEELDTAVREWLRRRPGAEHGDCEGVRVTLPR